MEANWKYPLRWNYWRLAAKPSTLQWHLGQVSMVLRHCFFSLPAYWGRLALHRDLSIFSAACWQGGMELWRHCGGAMVAGMYACLEALLQLLHRWGPTAEALSFYLHGKVLCRQLSALLVAIGQSNGRIPPQAATPLGSRRELPHCSGKEPTWKKERPVQSCVWVWGVLSAIC